MGLPLKFAKKWMALAPMDDTVAPYAFENGVLKRAKPTKKNQVAVLGRPKDLTEFDVLAPAALLKAAGP